MTNRYWFPDDDGVMTEFVYDEQADTYAVRTVQDVEPILEQNKRLQTDGSDGYGASRELRRVASIPNVVIETWMRQDGVNILGMSKAERTKYLRRKLQDPDYRHLLTAQGRVSFRAGYGDV